MTLNVNKEIEPDCQFWYVQNPHHISILILNVSPDIIKRSLLWHPLVHVKLVHVNTAWCIVENCVLCRCVSSIENWEKAGGTSVSLCHMYHITFSLILPTSPLHHQRIMIISVKFLYSSWALASISWKLVAPVSLPHVPHHLFFHTSYFSSSSPKNYDY